MSTRTIKAAFPGPISQLDFDSIRQLASESFGLHLEPGKEEFVASRLGKVMREANITSYRRYFEHVVNDRSSAALITMIDSLATNHTSFFRGQQHFDFLRSEVFPALANRERIDIWSAACSTGEEPFSRAFAAADFFGTTGPKLHILASDISTRALNSARLATYNVHQCRDLSEATLRRYLLRGTGPASSLYRIKPVVRLPVELRRINLMDSLHDLGATFPLILCRNTMIYFSTQTQEKLLSRLYGQLEPGGYLFVGHSESLNHMSHSFEYVCPAIYRKPGSLCGDRYRQIKKREE